MARAKPKRPGLCNSARKTADAINRKVERQVNRCDSGELVCTDEALRYLRQASKYTGIAEGDVQLGRCLAATKDVQRAGAFYHEAHFVGIKKPRRKPHLRLVKG